MLEFGIVSQNIPDFTSSVVARSSLRRHGRALVLRWLSRWRPCGATVRVAMVGAIPRPLFPQTTVQWGAVANNACMQDNAIQKFVLKLPYINIYTRKLGPPKAREQGRKLNKNSKKYYEYIYDYIYVYVYVYVYMKIYV